MRLNKYIASCGVSSRRGADEMIIAGRITINGRHPESIGIDIDTESDIVCLDGQLLKPEDSKVYIMLNKPSGVVSTCHDDKGRKTVLSLVRNIDKRIFPVGRLDYDTEGLLLLTNDGDFAYRCTHPAHEVDKEYLCIVNGVIGEAALASLCEGVKIDGVKTYPAKVSVEKCSTAETYLRITIHEGRNRQVRRMIEAVGSTVRYLKRLSEGCLKLGPLRPGQWRFLTRDEINQFLRLLQ